MPAAPSRREATHERIVEVASRAIRRHGYAGVGVADVMKQDGLTHGGFYAQFSSRDAMLAEAVARAGQDTTAVLARRMEARGAEGRSAFGRWWRITCPRRIWRTTSRGRCTEGCRPIRPSMRAIGE